jgi:hypothetical protein
MEKVNGVSKYLARIKQAAILLSSLGTFCTHCYDPQELTKFTSVRSEHPKDEEDYVIREGRILGGLEPSRAFGDARYKWPLEVQEV